MFEVERAAGGGDAHPNLSSSGLGAPAFQHDGAGVVRLFEAVMAGVLGTAPSAHPRVAASVGDRLDAQLVAYVQSQPTP